jgi:hypothetical protein
MRTKREADTHLMNSPLEWTILRSSLVVGADGDSSRFFRILASLPVVGLPGRGDQCLQPVHIDDLAETVVRSLAVPARRIVNVAGPTPMTYRAMLRAYRAAMDMAPPLWLPIPMPLMRVSAAVAVRLPQRVFSPDTLRMLEDGNAADSTGVAELLGRPPRGPQEWFSGSDPHALRWQALASWGAPVFRIVLALLWIATGILSFGLYPVDASLAMLARLGLHGEMAYAALYGAAALDCAIGIATLLAPGRILWRAQTVLILGYTAIITVFLPEFWLHPFGPLLKNLPILAILAVLDSAETE